MKRSIDINDIPNKDLYSLLTSAVIPRPIAFASTIDSSGKVNLSPFSYFNVFSSNPPIMIFSPVRRSADGSTKDTYQNIKEVPEVVINIVNYQIVQEMSLTSTGYAKGVNEFEKSGLTEQASVRVKPPCVAESPISFECKVNDIIELGQDGGAGSLVICEVVHIHMDDNMVDEHGKVDPYKLNAIARLGGNLYSRVDRDSIFEIVKPISTVGVGVDQLPSSYHPHFTSSEMAMLAGVSELPDDVHQEELNQDMVNLVKAYLNQGNIEAAWNSLKK